MTDSPADDNRSASVDSNSAFNAVFQLLDSRGFGKLNLESIFEFVSAVPLPPALNEVTQLYQQFDDDGSGDIDVDEFPGLCTALETLCQVSAREMLQCYERRQYEHLFEMVDDDGGGSISSQELKVLIESLHGMLNLKHTAADVALLLKEAGTDELDFEAFHDVMQKVMGGRSIVQVVRAFEEAQRRKAMQKQEAMHKLESFVVQNSRPGATKQALLDGGAQAAQRRARSGTTKFACINCAKKDAEIANLRETVASLEQKLAAFTDAKPPTEHNEPRVRNGLHNVSKAAPALKAAPYVVSAAVNIERARRVKLICAGAQETNPQKAGKTIAALADAAHKAQRQVGPVLTDPSATLRSLHALLVEFHVAIKEDKADVALATRLTVETGALRMKLEANAETLGWVVDAAVEAREQLIDAAVAAAPSSNGASRMMAAALGVEKATQKLADTQAVLLFFSGGELSELELLMQALVDGDYATPTEGALEEIRVWLEADEAMFGKDNVQSLVASLKETVYGVQAMAGSFVASSKRDRGVGTTGSPGDVEFQKKAPPMSKKLEKQEVEPKTGLFSRPPRVRDIGKEVDRRGATVDLMIERYLRSGVQVPPNFARVYTHNLQEMEKRKHMFAFGTRRIDLCVVDNHLAVPTGGGYMYFDEYCSTYTDLETDRMRRELTRSASPQPQGLQASASPSSFSRGLRSGSHESAFRSGSRNHVSAPLAATPARHRDASASPLPVAASP